MQIDKVEAKVLSGIKKLYSEETFEEAVKEFKKMLYELYCLTWEKEHPCTMEELIVNYHMSALDEGYESFDEYLEENGSDGNSSSPVCFEEWEDIEYINEEIIAELLHEVNQVGLLDHYLYIRKKEKTIESEEYINKLKKMLNDLYDEGCNADEDAINALEFAINTLSKKEVN